MDTEKRLLVIDCIEQGVAVITGVGAIKDYLLNGFADQGRTLLGGDITLRRVHKRANQQELAQMRQLGNVAETATMRSMARLPDGSDQSLVEIKAVGPAYPLLGDMTLVGGASFDKAVREDKGAVVAQSLLERLGLKVAGRAGGSAGPSAPGGAEAAPQPPSANRA